MTPLTMKYSTVVIVDGKHLAAVHLADRFRSIGAKVHVVHNAAAAAMIVRNKKVDVVFVGYHLKDGAALVRTLDLHGVPHITCASTRDMPRLARQLNEMALAN